MIVSLVRRGLADPYFEVRAGAAVLAGQYFDRLAGHADTSCCVCATAARRFSVWKCRPRSSRCCPLLPAGRLFPRWWTASGSPATCACARRSSAAFSGAGGGRIRPRGHDRVRQFVKEILSHVQLQARIQHPGKLSGVGSTTNCLEPAPSAGGSREGVSIFIMHLLREYGISYGYFRLFEYLTFRTMLAAITALLFVMVFGHPVIAALYRRRFRDGGRRLRLTDASSKRGTPTGGGLLIILAPCWRCCCGETEQYLSAGRRGRVPVLRPGGLSGRPPEGAFQVLAVRAGPDGQDAHAAPVHRAVRPVLHLGRGARSPRPWRTPVLLPFVKNAVFELRPALVRRVHRVRVLFHRERGEHH